MKRSQIILEGPDCSGKTTQFKEVWSKIQLDNNYQLLLNDRGLMSILAYGIANNRFDNIESIQNEFLEYLNKNIVVYFSISLETLKERFAERGDELQKWEDIEKVWSIYEKLKKRYEAHPNFKAINGDESISNIMTEIDHIVHLIKSPSYHEKLMQAGTILRQYGNVVDNTKELVNYEIEFDLNYSKIKAIIKGDHLSTPLANIRGSYAQLEIDSYNYQDAKFIKKLETILSGYYGAKEDIESRKFVFTDDECLSYFHILCRNKILYVNAHFRSSNIDLFHHDFVSICKMIKIFYDKLDVKYDIRLNIKFDSLHKYV
tara:strand:- start:129 stop:1079 length:951 start_codon:yes stop_codon:yes gene_type:complete